MEYIVKKGDTLGKIAKVLLGEVDAYKDIIRENNLSSDVIRPGQKLIIPEKESKSVEDTGNYINYSVKKGDNLSIIAKNFDTSLQELININNIKNANVLKIGQLLKIKNNKYNPQIRSMEDIYQLETEYNNQSDSDIINNYHKRNQTNEFYIIDDKKNNAVGVYKNGKLVRQFKAIHGKAKDLDDMTITKTDSKGNIINMGGNMSTPAGYYITTKTGDYHNAPAFMRRSPYMIEQGYQNGIPSSIHARTIVEGANTNGCTGMSKEDLKDLDKILKSQKHTSTYILPVESGNRFYIRNNQLHFQSNDIQQTPSYHPTTSIPIESIQYNQENYKEHNNNVINDFIQGIIDNKAQLQKDLKINDDTYDKLAKASLGILGVESNFGEKHTTVGNFVRAVRKFISRSNSSPDIYSKYNTYGGNKDYHSVGLTQIRFQYLSDYVKSMYTKYNITKDSLVNDPKKAAIATLIRLSDEYMRQGQNINKAIKSWNNKPQYLNMVNNKAKDFTLYKKYKAGGTLGYKNIIGLWQH